MPGGFDARAADAPVRGRPPGTLGTPADRVRAPAPLNGSPPAAATRAQYDAAMNLMSRAQYAEASAAFRAYADANPDDTDLAPQAIYWVGNIAIVQQDYATRGAHLRRSDQEISQVTARARRYAEAGPVLHGAWARNRKAAPPLASSRPNIPNASPQTLGQRREPPQNRLQQVSLRATRLSRAAMAACTPAPVARRGFGRRRFPGPDASAGAAWPRRASCRRPWC